MPDTQIDRRAADPALIMMQQIYAKQKELDCKMTEHMALQKQALAEAIAKLMAEAFPEGDPDGHRRHHELVIKAAEERAAFWAQMRAKLTEWGLIGIAGWAAYALWAAFLQGPHK